MIMISITALFINFSKVLRIPNDLGLEISSQTQGQVQALTSLIHVNSQFLIIVYSPVAVNRTYLVFS